MAFIAQVFALFRKLADVNWASITSSTPFLKWDSASDKIVGAPAPATSVGAGDAGRVVTGNADGTLAATPNLTYANDTLALNFAAPTVGGPIRISAVKDGNTVLGTHFSGGAYGALYVDGPLSASEYRGGFVWVRGNYVGKTYGGGMRMEFNAADDYTGQYLSFYGAPKATADNAVLVAEMMPAQGGTRLFATDATKPALRVKAAAGQSASLVEIQNASEAVLTRIDASGALVAPKATLAATGATQTPLTVQGAAGQAAPTVCIHGTQGQASNLVDFMHWEGYGIASIAPNGTFRSPDVRTLYNGCGFTDAGIKMGSYNNLQFCSNTIDGATVAIINYDSPGVLRLRDGGGNPGSLIQANLYVNSASNATTLGNVVKRFPVFDVNGAFLGYVPLYDSIN